MPSSEKLCNVVLASKMNQEGAALLLSGQVYKAATSFEQALRLMKRRVPSFLQQQCPITAINNSGCFDVEITEGRGFVYSKPFFFNQSAEPTEDDVSSYQAIISFNLALAYHMVGQEFRDGGKYLKTTKVLYELCLGLLNCQKQYDCSNVIIAALNNLACLNIELCYLEEAYQMLYWLEFLIKEEKVRVDTLHAEDFADVVLNMRVLSMPANAGAA